MDCGLPGAFLIVVGGGFVFLMIAKMLKEADGGMIDDANTPF